MHKIITATDMEIQIQKLLKIKTYDYIFMVAAIADYKVANQSITKIKSNDNNLNLELKKNPDIIKSIKKSKKTKVIGFALETNDGEQSAIKKLRTKGLDYVILNYANEEGAGFDCNTNHVFIFSKSGEKHEIPLDRKDRIAKKIIEYIL